MRENFNKKMMLQVLTGAITIGVIGALMHSSPQQSNTENTPLPLASIQKIVQAEHAIYTNIKESLEGNELRSQLYDISVLSSNYSEEYINSLLNILEGYLIDPDADEIYIFQSLSFQLGQGKIGIDEFLLKMSLMLGVDIEAEDAEKILAIGTLYHNEIITQSERFAVKKDNLLQKTYILQENITESLLGLILENNANLSDDDREDITKSINTYFAEMGTDISLEDFMDFIESISIDGGISLSYKEVLIEYIELFEILNYIQEINTQIEYLEGEIEFDEYQKNVFEHTRQIDSILGKKKIIQALEEEELISYITRELDYGEVELIMQERQDSQGELSEIQRNYFDEEVFQDDSEIIRDMQAIAYIKNISGNILIQNLAGGIQNGDIGDLLYAGYTLETLGDSEVTIVFYDDSIMRISNNSSVTLQGERQVLNQVSVNNGGAWFRVIKPLFSEDTFNIESGTIGLAVRGTSLYVRKNESGQDIYIIDSVEQDEENDSVTVINRENNEEIRVGARTRIQQSSSDLNTIQTSTVTRQSVLVTETDIRRFIRDDLHYLSVLLDDIERGFYNTILGNINQGENLVAKIKQEIEVTLPSQTEKARIFSNTELINHAISNEITSQNIYELTYKDQLIDHVKEIGSPRLQEIIQDIINTDINNIIVIGGSKRYIEKKIEEGIAQKIVQETKSVYELLLEDNQDEGDNTRRRLNNAGDNLQLPNGSRRVSEDIILPSTIENDSDISIYWESVREGDVDISNGGFILESSQEGQILKVVQSINQRDLYGNIQATLNLNGQSRKKNIPFVIPTRDLTNEEKLQKSADVLRKHIENIGIFTNNIPRPDFNKYNSVVPNIEWVDNKNTPLIDSMGNIERPSHQDGDTINHTIGAILTLGDHRLEIEGIELKKIKSLPEPPKPPKPKSLEVETRFPNCDTSDIALPNGQVWAMCNTGSNTAGFEKESYGDYLSFGRSRNGCPTGYRTPRRSDWNEASSQFSNFQEMQITMMLPNAGFYENRFFASDRYIHQGQAVYFWTRDNRSWCLSDCGYAFIQGNIGRLRESSDDVPLRCIRSEPHVFDEEDDI